MKRKLHTILPILASLTVTLSAACGPSLMASKPKSPTVNKQVTAMWSADVKKVARSGDWILSRSYSAIGDAIVIGTIGEELSHASIYDAERGTVIEAVSDGVREVPLDKLLDRNRVIVIVRPGGLTDAERKHSIGRARAALGRDFDYTGMIGANTGGKFYCTELVVWASGLPRDTFVITPAELVDRGEVVYFSGKRDDQQVQSAARARGRVLRTAALAKSSH